MGYPAPLDINYIPVWLSSILSTNVDITKLVASLLFVMIALVILTYLQSPTQYYFPLGVLLLSFFTSLGWLPYYFWVLIALFIGIRVSGAIKGWF